MKLARLILASLLPTIWLAASAVCLGTPVRICTPQLDQPSVVCACHGKQDCSSAACSFEQMIRRTSRRVGTSTGLDGCFVPLALDESRIATIQPADGASPVGCAPLHLIQGWQFLQRTALAPRAPSPGL